MRVRRDEGFTVVEILVASGAFLLMLGGLYGVYTMGLRYLRMAQTQSKLQQQASMAMQKVSRELSSSYDDAVTLQVSATPSYIWFLSTQELAPGTAEQNYDSSGHLLWQKWICYRLETSGQLTRSELPVAGGPVFQPFAGLTPPTLEAFRSGGQAQRALAEAVDSFQVTRSGAAAYRIIVITALPGMDGRGACKTRLETQVYILNNQ